jgi:hypothetical protein
MGIRFEGRVSGFETGGGCFSGAVGWNLGAGPGMWCERLTVSPPFRNF